MGTISKALNLLSYYSSDRVEIGLASFVRLSGADKATVRRHLGELVDCGFLEQHPETRQYRLGPAILRLAAVREGHYPIRQTVIPVLDKIASVTGELVHASLLQGNVMSPIYHADPKRHSLRVIYDEGEVLPLHATASGLAMLAFGDEEVTDLVLANPLASYAPNTVIGRSDVMQLISQNRAQGYSFSDQLYTREIVSFGVPFFGPEGTAIGAIALPLPVSRLTEQMQTTIVGQLIQASRQITRSCGGSIPAQLEQLWDQLLVA